MTSHENLGYNPTSSLSPQNDYSYRNLGDTGCFFPSPAPGMSDYGTRSVRDTINWIQYVEKGPKCNVAVPAAPPPLPVPEGTVEPFKCPPGVFAVARQEYLAAHDLPSEEGFIDGDPHEFNRGRYFGQYQEAPLTDPRHLGSHKYRRHYLGTQPLAPGF